jgi:hypothetical protein
MAKGAIAKSYVTDKLREVFGADFLGEYDKKIYVQAPENGEMVQIAIAMTCPKTQIEVSNSPVVKNGMMDFTAEAPIVAPQEKKEISDEERATIADMMKRLGL